jgi:hypothetical protein
MEPTSPEALCLASRRSLNAEFADYVRLEYPRERADWVTDHAAHPRDRERQWDDHPQTWVARLSDRFRRARIQRERARKQAPVPGAPAAAKATDSVVSGRVGQAAR